MTDDLKQCERESCAACRGELPLLDRAERARLRRRLDAGWRIVNGRRLTRRCGFPDFREALAFVNRVGEAAEKLAHHPEIYVGWGRARVAIWTYKVGGLTEADFQLAEMIDRIAGDCRAA